MLIDNAVFRAQMFQHCFHVCGVNLEIIWGAQTPPYFTPSSLFTLIFPTFNLKGSANYQLIGIGNDHDKANTLNRKRYLVKFYHN